MPRPPAPPPLALAVVGAATALGLVSASRMYWGYAAAGRPIAPVDALGSGLLEWWLWVPLLPAVRRLAGRFPVAPGRVARALLVHGLAALAASLVQIALFAAASAAIRALRFGNGSFERELAASFLFKLHTGVVAYGAAVCAFLALDAARRSREEALRRERGERALAEARLAAVQSQLAPHFLFNALNAVAASLRDAPDAAERMLARLAELLRTVLARRDDQEQTLGQELDFLASYLALQRERFGERLAVELLVDPAVREARVPTFLLLPLVENALEHGVGRRRGPVSLCVRAEERAGSVLLAVEDDGPGFQADALAIAGRGLGLESVRERLRLVHGESGRCELGRGAAGGAAIRLSFPARAAWSPGT